MQLYSKERFDQGFSLIEILVALGIGGVIMLATKDPIMESIRLQKLAKERSSLQLIEQDVRRAVFDKTSFALSAAKNPALASCINVDGKACKVSSQEIKLYLTATRMASGNFGFPGQNCNKTSGCPIDVKVSFTPICEATAGCDAAKSLQIEYSIYVSQALYKKGMMRVDNDQADFNDDAVSCGFDKSNRPTFANKIEPGKLSCSDAPEVPRVVAGVKPGECKPNLEVLVGFAADGAPICKPIKRSI